jgi:hypothetical protein
MPQTVWGIVRDGVIVPNSPLPEGTRVEIVLPDPSQVTEPELQEEFDAWDRASANALELVERLAQEQPPV